jgi:transcriptional antiterminator RfaH
MTRWFVVHTQPQAEAKAARHLSNQGFHCFLPRIVKHTRHARQTRSVLAPLFPRYLFVRIDLEETRWRSINGTRGVVGLLTSGPQPLPVPAGIVEALLDKSDGDGAIPMTTLGLFFKGLKVKIKSGVFAGLTGEIEDCVGQGYDRVRVLLTILGAETGLQVPASAVEAA